MDFLSQRWYLCDKEIISSISRPLKETGVHREEASAGKTCLRAGLGCLRFYPPSKSVSRRDFLEFAKETARKPRQQPLGEGVRYLLRPRAGRRRPLPGTEPRGKAGPKYRRFAARGGSKPAGRGPAGCGDPPPPGAGQPGAPRPRPRRMLSIPPPPENLESPK